MTIRILALILLLIAVLPARADLRYELQTLTEHLVLDGGGHLPSGGQVYQPTIVEEFYHELDYQPAWKERDQAEGVLGILKSSYLEGLNPEDYHYSELMALWALRDEEWPDKDRSRARFDVLLTDGLLLFLRHLAEGKIDPRRLDPTFNFTRLDFEPRRVSANLRRAIANDEIAAIVDRIRPPQSFYQQMKSALVHYRELDASRSFRPLPTDTVLKPGNSYPVVPALSERLSEMGYLPAGRSATGYDQSLSDAVRQFQRDHGLDVDGVVGAQSYQFLNMSYVERINSLRVNMDRVRWISQDISDEAIIVNIAGFELYYSRDHQVAWETPVMVGTIAHQTPIFTKRLKYLEFNPTWTVPRSIIGRSLLPKFKANPQYIRDNNYVLYDRAGQAVDPASIDWANATLRTFPYSVVQQPWEQNALGRVKFMFPNRYAIYLHDTPARSLFSRSARAFSSGCVRVKNPLEFAEVLLDDPDKWPLSQVEALVNSRQPQVRVNMERPVDVMLMYWTTSPAREGRLQFHADIYGKDPGALAVLNAPPRVY